MSETLPLLRGFTPADVLLRHRAAPPITAARFCGLVHALARSLPPARYAINCCEDPARFVVGSAAALARGQTLILPAAGDEATLRRVRASFADNYSLVDAPEPRVHAAVVPAPDKMVVDDAWPPPDIPAAHVAAILFTSGSTLGPVPHAKTWSSLVRGAATFARSFGPVPAGAAFIGTVAPQHMFGFETTVLVPWQTGAALVAQRPLFPGDLAEIALALAADPQLRLWLMTTPLHLRALHEVLRGVAALARVVVSTMPLRADLAAAVERKWNVPVDEIYGCTEGGMLATRRPALAASFVPAPGVRFDIDETGTAIVAGGQLDLPLRLADRLAWTERGDAREPACFDLVGRSGEFVKIAGKRATLSELSAKLQSIPGVRDGAFFAPRPDAPRLGALVAAPGHDARSLRRELALRMDRAFVPRPLLFVAALPRNAQGKLTAAAMRDAVAAAQAAASPALRPDRVLEVDYSIPSSHPALPGHFPGNPLVPGVVLLDQVRQLLRHHGVCVTALIDAKFAHPVRPEQIVRIRVELADDASARFRIGRDEHTAVAGLLSWKPAHA